MYGTYKANNLLACMAGILDCDATFPGPAEHHLGLCLPSSEHILSPSSRVIADFRIAEMKTDRGMSGFQASGTDSLDR